MPMTPKISIHAPARGATRQVGTCRRYHCISIHAPARGATFSLRNNFRGWNISIHAPARGATVPPVLLFTFCTISIHAPARGATKSSTNHCRYIRFQSTLPRGERRKQDVQSAGNRYFNPRSREGSDQG